MEVCLFCKSPVKKGQRFCPACGKGILQASADTTEPVPPFPSPPEDKPAICPACKAAYPSSARYCERDGALLEKVETYVLPNLEPEMTKDAAEATDGKVIPSEVPLREVVIAGYAGHSLKAEKRGFTKSKWLLASIFFIASASAIYFYMVGFPGGSVGVEEYLNKILKTRGFDVSARLEQDGMVVVTGRVQSENDRNAALAIIRSDGKVKGITDNIKVVLSPIDLERTLNKALDSAGLTDVQARVDREFVATITGAVQDQQEKTAALELVRTYPAVKGLNDDTEIKKLRSQGKAGETAAGFTQTAHFKVLALSPSTWASMKYRDSVTFRIPGPGRIVVEADWQPQGTLALILNNAASQATHAQKDGTSPLKLTYRVTPQDFVKGPLWEAVVANFTGIGPAEGSLKVIFSSGDTDKPPAPAREPAFDAVRVEGEINHALRDGGIKGVTAEVGKDRSVTLKGSVRSIDEKQKAIETAKQFKAIKEVKDIIFVVGS
jgi:osmotically-inducible protein OsmY